MWNIEFGPGVFKMDDIVIGKVEESTMTVECPEEFYINDNVYLKMPSPDDLAFILECELERDKDFYSTLLNMDINNWRKLHGMNKIRRKQLIKAVMMDFNRMGASRWWYYHQCNNVVQGTSSTLY